MKLNLYAIFHLNLAFSSIEEDQRPQVISACYWPLLRLVREQQLPLGIEASGFTLETIADIDPEWIAELRDLCYNGAAEFVGSGYAQVIGPLVPAEVNRWNQQLGLEVYQRLLNLQPQLVLVNEQAYSAGLVAHYQQAGYRGIVMEWDNPAHSHPEWRPELRYLPQRVRGTGAAVLPLVWNKSLPFQQFQRYAHGEWELDDYLRQLEKHLGTEERVFSLYGNDAEIFDFRPGRFATEACQLAEEWQRIGGLFTYLQTDSRFQLIPPGRVLDFLDRPGGGQELELQTARQPIPVKKQAKYNITRWAVTGRDDLQINSRCQRIYRKLQLGQSCPEDWRELCFFWSSDFRTHITERRWLAYQQRMEAIEQRLGLEEMRCESWPVTQPAEPAESYKVEQKNGFLEVTTSAQVLRINLRRGLAIDRLALAEAPEQVLVGTLPHGYFDDIDLGADYYTGHLVAEIPGDHKITDLSPVGAYCTMQNGQLVIGGRIETRLGPIHKRLLIPPDRAQLILQYRLDWAQLPQAALRLGHITLHPQAFSSESLFFRTHNGGREPETFTVAGADINHLASVTPLVTASQGLGVTEGVLECGDACRTVRVEIDPGQTALTAHIIHRPSAGAYLFRTVFSARELDDSCCASREVSPRVPSLFSFQLSFNCKK